MDVDHRSKGCFLDCPEGPPPSQTDSKVQMILQKQLETNITLNSQFEQHRSFCDAGELRSLPESSGGLQSIEQLQTLEKQVQVLTKLNRAGLNDQEIDLYLNSAQHGVRSKASFKSYAVEPEAFQRRLEELKNRVAENEIPSREVDQALASVECDGKSGMQLEDPFSYIAKFAKKLENRCKRKRQKKCLEAEESKPWERVDPALWHAVVPLQEEEILAGRLSLQEIQQISRFAGYEPGEPHSVLYLKNLHSKVRLEELIAVFGRYDRTDQPVQYRLMTGRMRGQAFVHFPDVDAATQALKLSNGYKLRGQPMIVTFAHRKESTK